MCSIIMFLFQAVGGSLDQALVVGDAGFCQTPNQPLSKQDGKKSTCACELYHLKDSATEWVQFGLKLKVEVNKEIPPIHRCKRTKVTIVKWKRRPAIKGDPVHLLKTALKT